MNLHQSQLSKFGRLVTRQRNCEPAEALIRAPCDELVDKAAWLIPMNKHHRVITLGDYVSLTLMDGDIPTDLSVQKEGGPISRGEVFGRDTKIGESA